MRIYDVLYGGNFSEIVKDLHRVECIEANLIIVVSTNSDTTRCDIAIAADGVLNEGLATRTSTERATLCPTAADGR